MLDLPLQNIITAHNPTMAEALKLVAISFTKDVNRLSCCAS